MVLRLFLPSITDRVLGLAKTKYSWGRKYISQESYTTPKQGDMLEIA